MKINIDIINESIDFLEEQGICRTQAEFSTDWLGASDGYYAYLKSSGAAPSVAALSHLGQRLRVTSDLLRQSSDLSPALVEMTRTISDLARRAIVAAIMTRVVQAHRRRILADKGALAT